MAVTITDLPAGNKGKKWRVTWALDGDTVATIPHGMIDAPDLVVGPVMLNTQAWTGQIVRTSVDATNIVLTKNAAGGSGGASVEIAAFRPLSVF